MLSARNINDFAIEFDAARLLDEPAFEVEDARTRVQPGDVLLTIVGSIGRVAVVPATAPRFTLQRSVAVLKPVGIDSRYLARALAAPNLQQWLKENAKGTAQKGVYLKTLGSAEVPVAPADEQSRIVEKLEELLSDLDAGVAELKAAQKKLQQYRQSLLKAAVEGSLTAAWREANPSPNETGAELLARILRERRARWETQQLTKFETQNKAAHKNWQSKYPEPIEPELEDLPALPSNWTWASLDMLGDIASGVAKGTKRDEATPVREVPYLRVANVQRGFLDLSEVKTILATERDIESLTLRDGDVLFNEGGDRDKLGRGWVWREEVPHCIHQNHVFRMRPFIAEINSEFVSHHGNTFGKRWFQSAGKQTTNLASINMGMLKAFPVPVPPATEQQAIVAQLAAQLEHLSTQEQAIEQSLRQSTAQRQNLLRAAFAGQLVPQDPNDEPASALLARIRAERASQHAAKQQRPRGRARKEPA
jgi:type I restriction enzyme S subunit